MSRARRPVLDEVLLLDLAEVEVVLVRHAQQQFNHLKDPARPRAGDAPLSDIGQRQAEAVGAALAGERIDAVYTSHLRRAHDTARSIARHHEIEPIVDDRLREVGIYEQIPDGRTVLDELGEDGLDDLHDRFEVSRRWDEFPYSETSRDLAARAMDVLHEIVSGSASERVVLVSHTGIINTIVSQIVNSRFDALFYPAHASFSRLAWGCDRFVVRTLNDHHHMCGQDFVTY